jgi:PhoPQ-activated pathogenicity-related protein
MRFSWLALLIITGSIFSAESGAARESAAKIAPAAADAIPSALEDYVTAPDDSYGYKVVGSEKVDGSTVHKLELTSQTWHDIPWQHALYIYVPDNVQHKQTVLLFITGGRIGGTPSMDDMKLGASLAKASAMPVAYLHQVPNQPLLGDKVEDDLISETFLRYVDSRDATWPLLFPMVKSATAAMTAIQDFGKKTYDVDVEQFVVTGGSKRGWTSWLTAAADDRVAGVAPIVIDTLNLPAQMKYQLETWGEYSEQIADYTSKGLVDVMQNRPDLPLWQWVDPYTYRSELKLPKLLINGTNDPYWTVDALNLYWDALLGEKHVRYVPNAGHGLDGGREAALMTLAAFAQHVAEGEPLPQLEWEHSDNEGELQLTINSTPQPESVRLWVARSDTKDFRNAKWEATELTADGDGEEYVGVVKRSDKGHIALFGEATYKQGALPYNLSTTLRRE